MLRPNQTVSPIPDNDPDAVPELWNARYREIDQNFDALDQQLEAAKSSITEHTDRLTAVENESAGSVSQAIRLDWKYRQQKTVVELFYDLWTLVTTIENIVIDAVAGDDSLDLNTVQGLEVGDEYVIFDGTNQESVVISEILTTTRVRCSANLTHSYTNAKIRKTSWELPGGKAVTTDGGVYLAGGINMGNELDPKALVIRRQDNAGELTVYVKSLLLPDWTLVNWSWKREIKTGVIDVEYLLPVRGIFDIKIVSSGEATEIDHMVIVDAETGLEGMHHPPETPGIVSPLDGATGIGEQPSITTGPYTHPAGVELLGSEFQISTAVDFSSLIDESGIVPGVSYSPAKDVLAVSTTYYAKSRHRDVKNGVSRWSSTVSFTTDSTFITVLKPTGVAPVPGFELGSPDGLTLISSAFQTEGGADTHANSQWQIAADPAFATILYDSGTDGINLTDYDVPDGTIERESTYYWRVRHEGTAEGWSDWSVSMVFSVAAFNAFVTTLGDSYHEQFEDVTTDGDGNIIAVGYESSTSSGGQTEALIAKFSADGSLIWQKRLGGSNYSDFFEGVAADGAGNAYAVGYESSGISNEALIAKFTSNGALSWQKRLGGNLTDHFYDVATDASGHVYAVGYEQSTTGGNLEALIVKFTSDGIVSWQKKLAGGINETFNAVAVDGIGNICAVGYSDSLGGTFDEALIAKFMPDGSLVWQKSLGRSTGGEVFKGIAIDTSTNIYAVGSENSFSHGSTIQALIAKFSTDGSLIWQKNISSSGSQGFFNSVAVDDNGDAYAVGQYTESGTNGLIAKFTSDGALSWQKGLGGINSECFYAITTSPDGNVYAAGAEESSYGWSEAILVSMNPEAAGANGTIPNITSLSWENLGFSAGSPGVFVNNLSLALVVTTLSLNMTSLDFNVSTLTQRLSEY
ncbi:MAG: SBBP repeat-containing protein [Desulfobacterales bacterium]|nr:SBBP repeat-containing protein [Desulfobacterales bacterium]